MEFNVLEHTTDRNQNQVLDQGWTMRQVPLLKAVARKKEISKVLSHPRKQLHLRTI
jgi:murein endopeptidase